MRKKASNNEVKFLSWCKAGIHALMHRKYTELLTVQTVVGDKALYELIP
ncbi:hypothetical protein LJB91_01525 [Bacteroidales bacterium OttesenSCG-928-L03]|nr:hypothetical protein [Bacteroidales bacterium OttesenSCG-928-L03]